MHFKIYEDNTRAVFVRSVEFIFPLKLMYIHMLIIIMMLYDYRAAGFIRNAVVVSSVFVVCRCIMVLKSVQKINLVYQ
jgi:hypothetical protein